MIIQIVKNDILNVKLYFKFCENIIVIVVSFVYVNIELLCKYFFKF